MAQEKWIQHAIKHKGAATEKADAEGLSVQEWAKKHQGDEGITGKQARLAATLHEITDHEEKGGDDDDDDKPAKKGSPGGMRGFY